MTRASIARRNSPPTTAAARSAWTERSSSGASRRRIVSRTPVGSGSGSSGGAVVVQAPLRGQQLDELVDEERVAGARVVHGLHEPRRHARRVAVVEAARARGRQAGDVVAAEAFERQPRGRAGEAAERRGQVVAGVRLGVAVGRDREDREIGQRAPEELEREHRRDVGPVQVVEHDDERAALGDGREQAGDRVEEAKARLVGVEVRRHRGRPERAGELGQQAGDPRSAGAEPGAQPGGVLAARERAGDLHPRPVRRRAAAVPARAPRPRGPAIGRVLDEGARERRLPDARLARHDDEPAAPRDGVAQRAVELLELADSPDEPSHLTRPGPHSPYVGAIALTSPLPARRSSVRTPANAGFDRRAAGGTPRRILASMVCYAAHAPNLISHVRDLALKAARGALQRPRPGLGIHDSAAAPRARGGPARAAVRAALLGRQRA